MVKWCRRSMQSVWKITGPYAVVQIRDDYNVKNTLSR